jgi:hypothetical protein
MLTRRSVLNGLMAVPSGSGGSTVMPIEFTQRHFHSMLKNIPPGGTQFITDTPDPLPSGPGITSFRHWELPVWFPQRVLINRAVVIYESVGYNTLLDTNHLQMPPGGGQTNDYGWHFLMTGNWWASRLNTETMMWVDPGGVRFSTANPPGSETGADISRTAVIMHEFTSNPMMNYDTGDLHYPIALDRMAGDKLAIQFNNSDALNWAVISLSFLASAPFQPT